MRVGNIVIGQKINSGKLVRAKELRRDMTPSERRLWERLRRNQLAGLHFRRQQIVDGFLADFYCHSVGVIVEVDGGVHDDQTEEDAARDAILGIRGFRILRVRNEEVWADLQGVLEQILAVCQEARRESEGI